MYVANTHFAQKEVKLRLPQCFSEDISRLSSSKNLGRSDTKRLKRIPNKVTINFNVFNTLMIDEIRRDVENSLIVAIKRRGRGLSNMQITEKIPKPFQFTTRNRHGSLFNFCKRSRNGALFLRFPRDRREFKRHEESSQRSPSNWTTNLTRIIISL